jgi:IS605 OrfB family transposase
MLLTKKIKLEVSKPDAATSEFMQGQCRGLYNWWVGRPRNEEKWNLYSAKKSLQASRTYDPELNGVYGKLLHEVYFRLDKAIKAFFRRLKAGKKPGFPRFKPHHASFTLCYPAMYIQVEGNHVLLPTGGKGKRFPTIQARLTEPPPIVYQEVAISRDGRGNYHASFVYEQQTQEQDAPASVVAFDLGIKTLATGVNSQGRVYSIGREKGQRCYNKQLDKIRSKRDRCKKGSRRYKHLSQIYSRVSEQKRNKQRDSPHKASHLISHKLVASTVVVGDLSQRQMAMREHHEKNKQRNRAVYNDWGLYPFLQMLAYKCQLYGKDLAIISERDTSKMCSACGTLQPMLWWKRTYHCQNENCSLKMDRDENSARNILKRFLARRRPHTGDPVRCADVFTAIDDVNTCEHV